MAIPSQAEMFRPPLARGMRTLDRSFFRKTVALRAVRVFDNKNISAIRTQLERSKDILSQERLGSVWPDPDPQRRSEGRKCVLLRPEVREEDEAAGVNGVVNGGSGCGERDGVKRASSGLPKVTPYPHSSVVAELVKQELISVVPYNLCLDYGYWTYHDIVSAILPTEAQSEIPSGFSQVGHVAHLNLREAYLTYKHLIAEILMDKNPGVSTVINKVDDVGEENEYRTFKYEVLAGPDDLNVEVSEASCTFKFDYSKVYWNPRLSTEHSRMVGMFREGEAVCDVMAGIGPFAVPAGKQGVFVYANDLNPDSYAGLADAVARNKVEDFVRPFNKDGRRFVREAAVQLLDDQRRVEIKKKASRNSKEKPEVLRVLEQPKTFSHFVLNLPASALEFLPSFIGLYPPELRERLPVGTRMPVVHVYCFSTKDELTASEAESDLHYDNEEAFSDPTTLTNGTRANGTENAEKGAIGKICAQISGQLQCEMKPGQIEQAGGVEVWDVRDVAPKKRMFCASFRLPEKVAFRSP